ncbi:hypothetical protein CR513_19369, partial [Mucuna pruriens]
MENCKTIKSQIEKLIRGGSLEPFCARPTELAENLANHTLLGHDSDNIQRGNECLDDDIQEEDVRPFGKGCASQHHLPLKPGKFGQRALLGHFPKAGALGDKVRCKGRHSQIHNCKCLGFLQYDFGSTNLEQTPGSSAAPYLCIKYPMVGRVGTMRVHQRVTRRCYEASLKAGSRGEGVKIGRTSSEA